ncbi:MAG TPA: tetratricopeptide repeat protein [Polaromonas sp.]|uniref:YfgM family protein n=1 Tax=Polaromonas sp. TaxID=1869339 RepID=UPI002D4ED8FC|nr:tetratricopeptide repeat protein [Polaromonas sp.]HYW57890.1 tetratricopeptide repeat protein [Polaromonas sp.]
MAKHLDLEEQEQLDELKHFWKQYGDRITWALVIILGAFAAWNGYNYWQRNQSAQAAMMYDEVERAVQSGEIPKLDRALADMKERFGGTAFAQQAGLLAAKTYHDKGNIEGAKSSLAWVAGKNADEGYQAIASLRLAGLLMEAKAYDEALKVLTPAFPKDFAALAADRRGDVLMAKGKKSEARAEYEKAYKDMDSRSEYRRLVEVKLNALGANPAPPASTPAVAAAASPASATEVKQ